MEKMKFKQRFERGKRVSHAHSSRKDVPGIGNSGSGVCEEQQGYQCGWSRASMKESRRWQGRGRADNLGRVTLYRQLKGYTKNKDRY